MSMCELHAANNRIKNFRDEANRTSVLGIQWFELPPTFRQAWRKATNYGQHPPSPEFAAEMPALLAAEQVRLEDKRREQAAVIAAARRLLRQTEAKPPCGQCLRLTPPCKVRCLRLLLEDQQLELL